MQPVLRLRLRRDLGDALADLGLEEGLGTRPPEQQCDAVLGEVLAQRQIK